MESLRVLDNGTITWSVCAVGGDIGRLGGPIALPQGPILCTAEVCSCIADILNPKARVPTDPGPAWP